MHLACAYFDTVDHDNADWALDAVTCLILACKFNERDDCVPLIETFVKANTRETSIMLTKQRVHLREFELMQMMDFDLNKVTLLHFIDNFAIQGFLVSSDCITS